MSETRGKKRMDKKEKKAANAKKPSNTLELNEGATVKGSCATEETQKCLQYKT